MRAMYVVCALMVLAFPAKASDALDQKQETLKTEISDLQESVQPLTKQASLPAQSKIHSTIEQQLRAIRDRDDRAAYILSTAQFEDEAGDAHDYMRDLRRNKPSLYNHVYYKILPSSGNSKLQKVKLIDRHGKEALAMFRMEHDNGGSWKIGHILILKTDEDPI